MSICPLLSMITMKQSSTTVKCYENQCQWWNKCKSNKVFNEPPFGLWEADIDMREVDND